jgi:hypothetical protein
VTTIEIVGWKKDFVPFNAWANNPRTELTKRLRRAINTCPGEIKRLNKQILAHQSVALHHVDDKWVFSVMQILEAMGAETRVSLATASITVALNAAPPRAKK